MASNFPALLVDFGGVLTNSVTAVLEGFCVANGLAPDAFTALQNSEGPHSQHFHAYERGEIDAEEFMPQLSVWLDTPMERLEGMLDNLEVDPKMFAAVGELRDRGVPTCLLSNSWGTAVYPMKELRAVFDDIVISELVGMRKPEPRIYEHAASLMDRAPDNCVFLDDTLANVVAAEGLGMTGIHVTARRFTLDSLQRIYGQDLAAFY